MEKEIDVLDKLMTPEIKKLMRAFDVAGFEIRFVGGCVRDAILGEMPKDVDFCTDATPNEMRDIATINKFKFLPTGVDHGTATLVVDGEPFEVTTLRVDTETDGRHATVEFTRSFEVDAERRDLTINAMSMDSRGEVFDYFGGREDLANRVVRFVGDARLRVQEDYLRILRYFRFAARFDAMMAPEDLRMFGEPEILDALNQVSVERFWQEMSKLLAYPARARVLDAMFKSGVNRALGVFRYNPVEIIRAGDTLSVLSTLIDAQDVEEFFKFWKMSRDEEAKIRGLLGLRGRPVDRDAVLDMMARDGVPRDVVVGALEIQGEPTLARYAETVEVPVLPVRGQDLLDLGMKPGKDVGVRMKRMRDAWVWSRYTKDRDALLAMD